MKNKSLRGNSAVSSTPSVLAKRESVIADKRPVERLKWTLIHYTRRTYGCEPNSTTSCKGAADHKKLASANMRTKTGANGK